MPILLRRDMPEAVQWNSVDDEVMTQAIGQFPLQGINRIFRLSRTKDEAPSDISVCSDKCDAVAVELKPFSCIPGSFQFDHNWRGRGFWRGKACTRLTT